MEALPKENFLYDAVLPKVELLSWLIGCLGLIMRLFLLPGDAYIMTGLGGLAVVCFLRTFEPLMADEADEQERPAGGFLSVVAAKVGGLAGTMLLLGILFKLLFWQGAASMLLVSVPLLLLAAAWQASVGSLRRQTLLILGIGAFTWALPTEALARQFFRDDPALVAKLLYQAQHPHDRAAAQAAQRARAAWHQRRH